MAVWGAVLGSYTHIDVCVFLYIFTSPELNKIFSCERKGSLGPQTWNGLPNDTKSAEILNIFKTMLKRGRALSANAIYVNMYIEINFLLDRK